MCYSEICTLALLSKGALVAKATGWENSLAPNTKAKFESFCLKYIGGPLCFTCPFPAHLTVGMPWCPGGTVKCLGSLPHQRCSPTYRAWQNTGGAFKNVWFYWSGVQLGFLPLFRWFYCTARVKNLCTLAPCHFLLVCGTIQGSSSSSTSIPQCLPKPAMRKVNGCLNNPE